jgi:hypothetical protein
MAKNDTILIDGVVDDIMRSEGLDRGEAFELFSLQQILKSYDLTRDEIDFGWVDGKDDGGIDGFYTFVNGVLLRNPNDNNLPRKNVSIDIWIVSCKHHDSFKQAPLNTLFPTIEELLDFTKEPADFDGQYSEELIGARQLAVHAFRRTASALPIVTFNFAYATRGDLTALEENIEARGNQTKRIVSDYFSSAGIFLDYFGATQLIELHRKSRVVLELPYVEELAREQNGYVFLVPIDRYARFVGDDKGQLRRYLFDSNVRDFLGLNRVNLDIFNSLSSDDSPDFWWLNNGVTILATNAVPLGKLATGKAIQLHDVQIVNGLQTTQSIHNYFKIEGAKANDRCVLVKVIISEDESVRDAIIQATNNQSQVELASLNATDKIQRDIEDILERHDWYYERRKNYYKNIGKPPERFVTPILLAVSLVSILKKAPHRAGQLKTRFMRNPASYEAIFSDKHPIDLWPKLAGIMKCVEIEMINSIPRLNASGHRTIGNWRGAVALCALAKIFCTFKFDQRSILDFDLSKLTSELVENIFSKLRSLRASLYGNQSDGRAKKFGNIDLVCQMFGKAENISDDDVIGRWSLPTDNSALKPATTKSPINKKEVFDIQKITVSEAEIERVARVLPQQPWPQGIQQQISESLGLDKKTVQIAVKRLIESGVFLHQYTGVVVDAGGYIVAVDPSRADPKYVIGTKYSDY